MSKTWVAARGAEKLMSFEAYAKTKHETPYLYDLADGKSALRFFGSRHSTNPQDRQFSKLQEQFHNFAPDVVFVEGLQSARVQAHLEELLDDMSFAEAARRGGEAVYTVKLATEHGVPWVCPEPHDRDLYANLLTQPGVARQHIASWLIAQLFLQWQRRTETVSFTDYAERFVELFLEDTQWEDFDYSLGRLQSAAEAIVGVPLAVEHRYRIERALVPFRSPHDPFAWTPLNSVARYVHQHRDEVILADVTKVLEAGKRAFVVFGAGHAVRQRPVYEALLESL